MYNKKRTETPPHARRRPLRAPGMQAIPNSTWSLAARCREQPAASKRSHAVWSIMHRPFVLPPWAEHTHSWQAYDVSQAGCVLCGKCHWCDPGVCETVACEDGATVCPVTAYCIPCIRTCEQEFSDCQSLESSSKPFTDDKSVLAAAIQVYVRTCLSGAATRRSLEQEYQQLQHKRVHTLLRVCRRTKQQLPPGAPPNVIDIACEMYHELQRIREPVLLSGASLEDTTERCAEAITRLLVAMEVFKRNTTDNKLFSMVVGLMYMMRQGITSRDTELLPIVPILTYALPLESNMHTVFGLRSKVITETENVVKMGLRLLSKQSLHHFQQRQYS